MTTKIDLSGDNATRLAVDIVKALGVPLHGPRTMPGDLDKVVQELALVLGCLLALYPDKSMKLHREGVLKAIVAISEQARAAGFEVLRREYATVQ